MRRSTLCYSKPLFACGLILLLSGCTEVLSFGVGFGAGFFTGQYYAQQEMKDQQSAANAAAAMPDQTAYAAPVTPVQQQPAPIPMGGYAMPPAYDYSMTPAPATAPSYSAYPAPAAPTAYPGYDPYAAASGYGYGYGAAPTMPPAAAPAYDPYYAQAPMTPAPAMGDGMPSQRYVPQG